MGRPVPVSLGALAVVVAAGAALVAPGEGGGAGSDLADYTDPGDACPQALSAISYLDDALLPLGQEPYQDFTDGVRSRLAAVGGTLALEAADWPDGATRRQARVVQGLAEAAAAPAADGDPARARALLRYRVEAGRLVELCRTPA